MDRSMSNLRTISRAYSYGTPDYGWNPDGVKRAIWLLIGTNTAVFGAWQYADATRDSSLLQLLHDNATSSTANLRAGRYWTLLTAAFSQKDLTHFAFNMWGLYMFGRILAYVPGVRASQVLGLAVGSALAGSLSALYFPGGRKETRDPRWGPNAQHFKPQEAKVTLGASGVVMGVAAAAAGLMPSLTMYIFPIPIPIPLWITVGLYAATDYWYLDSGDNRSHSAHLAGTAFGAFFYAVFLKRYGGVWHMLRRGPRY
ncbi:hypothetical protein LTR08_008241 [Meristemomyces frigidus]|nr:hypothetical protein LTR08_008241 [Meristemomyces frigidus]